MGNYANVNVTIPEPPAFAARRFANGDEILGRYVVQSELGQGGMGVVYRCFDKVGGVEVAVKGLPPEVSHSSDEMEMVRENFQLVSELHHPNIAGVRTLEKDPATGDYYLVMTLARGVSLRHWLRKHGGGEHRAEQIAVLRQIASALDYAHSAEPRRVIHRDIKPENVMVDDGGHVMVLDFGLAAQVRSSLGRVSQLVTSRSGTPAYKSPEQWLAQPQREPADQYSLGVIAYQMFAGELPYDSDDIEILKHAVVFDPVPAIPGAPKAIDAAFARVLAKKPQDRFASCAAFVAALEGRKVAKPGGTRTPARASLRDSPLARGIPVASAIVGIAAALVIAAFGGWWFGRGGTGMAKSDDGNKVVPKDIPSAQNQPRGDASKTLGGVQLWENGPYWAECNVGAKRPEDTGYYFWWGDTVGYKLNSSADGWVSVKNGEAFSFNADNCPTYGKSDAQLQAAGYIDSSGNLAAKYDAATAHLGAPWRMPTASEIDALDMNCDTEWIKRNGVAGRLVKGRGAYSSRSIFLPATGDGHDSYLGDLGSYGSYWSSTPDSGNSNCAWYLNFGSSNVYRLNDGRDYGQSVRPVRGFAQ